MCGIVGYVGTKRQAYPILIKGLKRLEYRGYDSAGVALINPDGVLSVDKEKGKVADLERYCADKDTRGTIGIAHTRWATHGEPSARNAHPHYSQSRNLAIIHNGIIENYAEIKARLEEKGVRFRSDTDTEVLVQLIEYIQERKQIELLPAVQLALHQVVGAYAIACSTVAIPTPSSQRASRARWWWVLARGSFSSGRTPAPSSSLPTRSSISRTATSP